ncbi:hypothetical protein Q9F35_004270 [Vibrio harveyi]|uniref:hypothetical protein n=1 Tax=Vibrio harveyi TaxID=669 RepID=UPI00068221B0|nr:hypothetical protein [Vibrio harveyi]ELH7812434.1 hypothetical protein [Vibrio harveyi]
MKSIFILMISVLLSFMTLAQQEMDSEAGAGRHDVHIEIDDHGNEKTVITFIDPIDVEGTVPDVTKVPDAEIEEGFDDIEE